ncbi:MAG: hypothetical protein COA31_013960 [Flavobacteriales bacterium]|nr:hypothetical protein [Flavobacteriales bacterium]
MKKIIHISFFCLLGLFSCNSEKTDTNNNLEKPNSKAFPVVIDTIDFGGFDYYGNKDEITWQSTANYHFFYIGPHRDTLIINHRLSYSPPPPPPNFDSSKHKVPEYINPLESYYLDWLEERNYQRWDSAKIEIKIDTTTIINNSYPVVLTNNESDTIFIGYGHYIPIIMEAKDSIGVWQPIQEQFVYTCGNGVGSIILPPEEIILTSARIFKGTYQTNLRLTIGNNSSKEFKGSIHYRQFESMFTEQGDYKEEYKKEMKK